MKPNFLAILAALTMNVPHVANAQSTDECFPNLIKFDVCSAAKKMQGEMAKSFPMNVSRNMTLMTAAAFGPRLAVMAVWHMTGSALNEMLIESGMTHEQLASRMNQDAQTFVCGQKQPTAAFVRLGGQIQYIYITDDYIPVASPTITQCPPEP
jgi:hypothetical protein